MEPNQNMAGEGDLNTASVAQQNNAGAPEPEQSIASVTEQKDLPESDNLPGQNVVPTSNDDLSKHDTTEKKKGGNGMMIGMILAFILAVGGIGFGVWAMMDGNQQKEELNLQISTLKKQNSELMERISVLEEEKESRSILDEPEEEAEEEYYEMEGLGIKIKKSEDFPDMVVKKNNDSTLGTYTIKRESSIPDNSTAPDAVSWMKSSTCDPDELNLGYGAKMEIGGSCYLMGEIMPYGAEPEYPLTDFLKYVMDAENYLAI